MFVFITKKGVTPFGQYLECAVCTIFHEQRFLSDVIMQSGVLVKYRAQSS